MNVKDVFPPINLPDPAVPWARGVQERTKLSQKEIESLKLEVKNHNRTTAAVTSELARQLDDLQLVLEGLEDLYDAIPKTRQLSATSSGFSAGENWTTICSTTVSFPEGSNHVEISAFGNAGLAWAGGERVSTLNGRMVIRGGSGPYVSADEFSVAGQYMAVLTPQNTRSLDGTQDFQVELQARATDPLAYPADADNYASLTVLATFTG